MISADDHNFVLNGKTGKMKLAAKVYEPKSGHMMEIQTTEPGVQFYSTIGLDGSLKGKDGKAYVKYGAPCLESSIIPIRRISRFPIDSFATGRKIRDDHNTHVLDKINRQLAFI